MKNKKIFIVVAIVAIILTLGSASLTIGDSECIMESYYGDGEYEYLINTTTDVVYIRYEFYKQLDLYNLIPLYKADGTIMTGVELKSASNDEEVVIYEELIDELGD